MIITNSPPIKNIEKTQKQKEELHFQIADQNSEVSILETLNIKSNHQKIEKKKEIPSKISIVKFKYDESKERSSLTSNYFTEPLYLPVKSLKSIKSNRSKKSKKSKKSNKPSDSYSKRLESSKSILSNLSSNAILNNLNSNQIPFLSYKNTSTTGILNKNQSSIIVPTRYNSLSKYSSYSGITNSPIRKATIEHSEIIKGIIKIKEDMKIKSTSKLTIDKKSQCKLPTSLIKMSKTIKKKDVLNKEKYSVNEIEYILYKIFLSYSDYSLKSNENLLKISSFFRILNKINILSKLNIPNSEMEIIIKYNTSAQKSNSSFISFSDFLNIITTFCSQIYQEYDTDPLFYMSLFINHYFIELYSSIDVSVFENIVKTSVIDDQIHDFMRKISVTIKVLYEKYFIFESFHIKADMKTIRKESLKSLLLFCKDFDIVPSILNHSKVVEYYCIVKRQDILFEENQGRVFTLSNFVICLFHFSIYYYNKYLSTIEVSSGICDYDKFMFLLERIHVSKGFENFEKRFNVKLNEKVCFSLLNIDNLSLNLNLNMNHLQKKLNQSSLKTAKPYSTVDDLTGVSIIMQNTLSLDQNFYILKEIFQVYSKVGQHRKSISTMSLSGWICFLKDSHLINFTLNSYKTSKNKGKSEINDLFKSTKEVFSIEESKNESKTGFMNRRSIRHNSMSIKKGRENKDGNGKERVVYNKEYVSKMKQNIIKVVPIKDGIYLNKLSLLKGEKVEEKNKENWNGKGLSTKSISKLNTTESLSIDSKDSQLTLEKVVIVYKNLIFKNKCKSLSSKKNVFSRIQFTLVDEEKEVLSRIDFESFINGIEQLAYMKYSYEDVVSEEAVKTFFNNDLILIINQFGLGLFNESNKKSNSLRRIESLLDVVDEKYNVYISSICVLLENNMNLIFNLDDATHHNKNEALMKKRKTKKRKELNTRIEPKLSISKNTISNSNCYSNRNVNVNQTADFLRVNEGIKFNFNEFQYLLSQIEVFPCFISLNSVKDLFFLCETKNMISLKDTCLCIVTSCFINKQNDCLQEEEQLYFLLNQIRNSNFGRRTIRSQSDVYKLIIKLHEKVVFQNGFFKERSLFLSGKTTFTEEDQKYENLKSMRRKFSDIR